MIFPEVIDAIHARKQKTIAVSTFAIYCFCLLNVAIFGHFVGLSVFGATTPRKAETAKENQIGFENFNKYCSVCHPNGGNKYKAHLPLVNAPQLANFDTFRAYIRNPKARDGSSTIMMAFPAKILSEQESREIYRYIVEILKRTS